LKDRTLFGFVELNAFVHVSDPHFSSMFDGYLEEIHFKTPSTVSHGFTRAVQNRVLRFVNVLLC